MKKEAQMLVGEEHVQRYVETDGQEGHDWEGTRILLLTTTGRRSGTERRNALIYGRRGKDYLVVASRGGSDEPPAWYRNLEANPEVKVQVLGERFTARARTATPEERPALWRTMTAEWPAYDEYQQKTERQIQVVILERV
jgi:deazaflavin-dependent oxidoreductase (nitroreductase family)